MLALLKKLSSAYGANFAPKLYEVLRAAPYTINEFRRDSIAGMTVAVVSIPLAMALAIASGVSRLRGCIPQLWPVSLLRCLAAAAIKLAVRPELSSSLSST